MPSIECRDLSYRAGTRTILSELSFGIDAGEWVWLLGPTGGGKTTLLRLLAGLEKPTGGEIALEGRIASASGTMLAPHLRSLAWLPQEPSLWPHLSALANVALGAAHLHGFGARRRNALDWLERLDCAELAGRFPDQLSGGEARGVELARVLAARPRILLLDEPTAHLDPHLREELMGRVGALHRELGLTTLCATHQIEEPMQPNERVLLLIGGRLQYEGRLEGVNAPTGHSYLAALRRRIEKLETPEERTQ